MTGKTNPHGGQAPDQGQQTRGQTKLEYRYGEIGIEAVAAAARFSGTTKPQADTQARVIDQRFMESAV